MHLIYIRKKGLWTTLKGLDDMKLIHAASEMHLIV